MTYYKYTPPKAKNTEFKINFHQSEPVLIPCRVITRQYGKPYISYKRGEYTVYEFVDSELIIDK
jgi:hypothetical protein